MSEVLDEQVTESTPVAPRKPNRTRKEAAAAEPEKFVSRMLATDKEEDAVFIRLHASEKIPPGGVPFGVNGRQFIMAAEVWYKVPEWLLTTIDNIIGTRPVKDEFDRLTGHREMKVYPYEVWRG